MFGCAVCGHESGVGLFGVSGGRFHPTFHCARAGWGMQSELLLQLPPVVEGGIGSPHSPALVRTPPFVPLRQGEN